MAYVADLSFLDDPCRFIRNREVEADPELAAKKELERLVETGKPLTFGLAPVSQPAAFAASLFPKKRQHGLGLGLPPFDVKAAAAAAAAAAIYSPPPFPAAAVASASPSPFPPSLPLSPPPFPSFLSNAAAAAAGGGEAAAARDGLQMKKGTTTLAFIYKGGAIVAVDSRASMGTYISSQTVVKINRISDIILGTMAGGAADCTYWERHLALLCRLFQLRNGEPIPVAAASTMLANIFYHWRGYGLCCGTMLAGWNLNSEEPELYFVDDQATRVKGKMFSCGSGSTYAYGVLDSGYKWDMTDEEAIELGKRAIYQAGHRDGGSGGVVRVAHIFRGGWKMVIPEKDISELHYEYAQKKGMLPDEL